MVQTNERRWLLGARDGPRRRQRQEAMRSRERGQERRGLDDLDAALAAIEVGYQGQRRAHKEIQSAPACVRARESVSRYSLLLMLTASSVLGRQAEEYVSYVIRCTTVVARERRYELELLQLIRAVGTKGTAHLGHERCRDIVCGHGLRLACEAAYARMNGL